MCLTHAHCITWSSKTSTSLMNLSTSSCQYYFTFSYSFDLVPSRSNKLAFGEGLISTVGEVHLLIIYSFLMPSHQESNIAGNANFLTPSSQRQTCDGSSAYYIPSPTDLHLPSRQNFPLTAVRTTRLHSCITSITSIDPSCSSQRNRRPPMAIPLRS
jgi:hypothetical protein